MNETFSIFEGKLETLIWSTETGENTQVNQKLDHSLREESFETLVTYLYFFLYFLGSKVCIMNVYFTFHLKLGNPGERYICMLLKAEIHKYLSHESMIRIKRSEWAAAKMWIPIFQYSPSMTMSVWSITKSLREGCTELALSRELLKKKNYSSLCTVWQKISQPQLDPPFFPLTIFPVLWRKWVLIWFQQL